MGLWSFFIAGVGIYYIFAGHLASPQMWVELIFSIFKMSLPAWLLWFFITQFIKTKDLLDKYVFKKNTLTFFETMRKRHIRGNDKNYESLVNKSIDTMLNKKLIVKR